MKRPVHGILVALLLALPCCGGGGGASGADAGPDVAVDADVEVPAPDVTDIDAADGPPTDTAPVEQTDGPPPELPDALHDAPEADSAVEDIEPSDLGPMPEPKEMSEPAPLPVAKWLVSYANDPNNDPTGAAIDAGTFTLPAGPGIDDNGIKWYEREPGPNGEMGYAGYVIFYAAANVTLPEDAGIVVRADRFYSVYVNGQQQPGDPYMTRQMRTPAAGKAGSNLVVAVAYQAVNDPEIQLFTTPDQAYFNFNDLTTPDLLVGDASELYVGVPVLNFLEKPLRNATARVVGSGLVEETTIDLPSLPPVAVTQVPFRLQLKNTPASADVKVPITVRLESHSLDWSYERTFELITRAQGGAYKHTRLSNVDGSVQFYGVQPPTDFDPEKKYALALSLHGAGVGADGQAGAYSAKDWIYLVAATNRRPFGFDWEEWGRLDGIETLEHAMDTFNIDPTRVYVTGHSMGGHGTWQFGVHFPGRFAVVGPSAGWSSFYSYAGGSQKPTGAFGRARASSDTLVYVPNLTDKPVYVIHGDADDNVPISEAYLMVDAVEEVTNDLTFWIQPGAGHWWDGDASPGADCVDWPPLFDLMKDRQLDLTQLDFTLTIPSPWVNASRSYVTVRSQTDPYQDSTVESLSEGSTVKLTTFNVRSMVLDGKALKGKGMTKLTVDDKDVPLADGPIAWGPQEGKTPGLQGPFNQVFHRPFCFLYPSDGPAAFRQYASYLTSEWAIIGNGHACAMPVSKADATIHEQYNLIYLGVPRDQVPVPEAIPFDWNDSGVTIGAKTVAGTVLLFVFPEQGHLSAVLFAPPAAEHMLFWHMPFTSRSGMPDYVAWNGSGAIAAGFFDADWSYDPALGTGP